MFGVCPPTDNLSDETKSVSHERFESQLQLIWDDIRTVKEKFGALFLNEVGISTRKIVLGNQSNFVEQIEQNSTTIDWVNLEIWIQNANELLRSQQQRDMCCLTLWGYNAQEIDWFDVITRDPIELLKASPAGQNLRRNFGPEWSSAFTGLSRFHPTPSPGNTLDKGVFQKLVAIRTEKIAHDWTDIRRDSEGRASFRKQWSKLTRSARQGWLRDQGCIPTEPHSHIYYWAQTLDEGEIVRRRRLFLSSLLNIEDLSDESVLPDFLDVRAGTHPRVFRHIDSPSVAIGVYSHYLSLKCVPGMIARFPSNADDTDKYHVLLQCSKITECISCPSDPCEDSPGVALLQLEAQQLIYEFLAGCLAGRANGTLDDTDDQSYQNVDNGACLSLLTRIMRLDYYGRPGTLDMKYLSNIVSASLEEACEDLWLLRQDYEALTNRLAETPGSQPGRTSNLLGVIFGRIDAFHTIKHRLLALEEHKVLQNRKLELVVEDLSEDGEGLRLLMSLHVACVSVLEEQLDRMTQVSWPVDTATTCSVLLQLLELLKTNDPTLRVLGLPAVMRVIEREIEKSDIRELATFTLMQALNDISVLVGCLEGTAKHYNVVSFHGGHIALGNALENEWKNEPRPWTSILKNTLTALGKIQCGKLNGFISSRNIDAESRYRQFWITIDHHMALSSKGNITNEKVIAEIQQMAPVNMLQVVSEPAIADWVGTTFVETRITSTMLKQSRCHRTLEAELVTPIAVNKQPAQTIPIIKPSRDRSFWIALSSPSSESRSELLWSDFEKAMIGIGYEMHRHGGSGRRFEYGGGTTSRCVSQGIPGTIVFHEPHGKRGKVPHRLAQSLWLRRLRQRFELVL